MRRAKSVLLSICICLLAMIVAACNAPAGPTAANKATTSSSTATLPSYARDSGPRASSTVIVVGNTGLPIRVYRMMVNGKMQNVLTNDQGMTLYYDIDDTPTSVCVDSCAWDWPPLLVPEGSPTSAVPLPGKLGILVDANGRQVIYNGHPLYLFAVDSGPHQTTGEGEEGDWHVATTSLPCKYHQYC